MLARPLLRSVAFSLARPAVKEFPGRELACKSHFAMRFMLLLLLLVCAGTVQNALAGPGFQPVSPDELKMTSEPQAPGASAVILYWQLDRDDNSQTSHEDNYFRIKILSEEGRNYANINIPFFKGETNVVNIRARAIKPDGSITNFDGQIFEKSIVKARGFRYFAKTFTLPDVQVGGIIEYYYTVDLAERFIYDSSWVLSHELFTKRAQLSLKPYQNKGNSVPIGLHWICQRVPSDQLPKQDPDRVIRMQASNIPAFAIEDYMPPINELKERVDFIYQEGAVERDADLYWKNLGKKRNDALESFIGKPKAMREAVDQIISPNDAPEVKLRKIYDRVQQIRNTSYEPRKTDQQLKREKQKPPENVEEVWKRGYANGQDLTWLYLGLVRAAGFEAYGCWVSSRREYFFNPRTMQGNRLNANVVQVKFESKELFLDPGAAYTPFGLLTWSETGAKGLRLDKDGGTWIKTPLPASSESQIERAAKLKLFDSGELSGKLTITYTGLEAMYRRRELMNEDDVSRRKSLEDQAKRQIPVAAEVDLTNKPDWTSSETPLVAEFDLRIPDWMANAGKKSVIPAAVFTADEKHIFEHASREHPIYFEYPYEKVDDLAIELPLKWQVSRLPPAKTQDVKVAAYFLKVEELKGTLHLARDLRLDILFLEQENYPQLRDFFQVVRTGDDEQIVLQPGPASASN